MMCSRNWGGKRRRSFGLYGGHCQDSLASSSFVRTGAKAGGRQLHPGRASLSHYAWFSSSLAFLGLEPLLAKGMLDIHFLSSLRWFTSLFEEVFTFWNDLVQKYPLARTGCRNVDCHFLLWRVRTVPTFFMHFPLGA